MLDIQCRQINYNMNEHSHFSKNGFDLTIVFSLAPLSTRKVFDQYGYILVNVFVKTQKTLIRFTKFPIRNNWSKTVMKKIIKSKLLLYLIKSCSPMSAGKRIGPLNLL